jgi:hypothetical protein
VFAHDDDAMGRETKRGGRSAARAHEPEGTFFGFPADSKTPEPPLAHSKGEGINAMWTKASGIGCVGLVIVSMACSSSQSTSNPPTGSIDTGGGSNQGTGGSGAETGAGGVGADTGAGGSAASIGTGGSAASTGTGGTAPGAGGGALASGGSGATIGTGGSAGAQATGGVGGACAEASSTSTAVPPVLEILIDISFSMSFTYAPSTFGASKWAATEAALNQVFASLPSSWAIGISYFSKPTNQASYVGQQAVAIAPLTPQQLSAIDTSLSGVTPGGLTPTLVAWQFARQQVSNWVAPAGYEVSPRYVVLITDGVPTVNSDGRTTGSGPNSCITQAEYDNYIQTVTAETQNSGVKTFVIGVPGSDDPQGAPYDPLFQLSLFAIAAQTAPAGCTPTRGAVTDCYDTQNQRNSTCLTTRGTYCLYDMTLAPDFTAAMVSTLNAIATQVISCTYTVPAPPVGQVINPNYVKVTYDPSSGTPRDLRRATDTSCTDGQWYFSAFDAYGQPTQIDLCPDTCSTAKGDTGASILVTFTCNQVQ